MAEAMSKKEKLARGSAVIKVMKVIPRPGHFMKSYIDPRKLPRSVRPAAKGLLAEMPWLDVKSARFEFSPRSAKVAGGVRVPDMGDVCDTLKPEKDPKLIGLPNGDPMISYFGYRSWMDTVNPLYSPNIAEHFNVMIGLLISMAKDPENQNFADVEAYPCVQFLKTVTVDGEMPHNVAKFITYIEYVCQKMCDEG